MPIMIDFSQTVVAAVCVSAKSGADITKQLSDEATAIVAMRNIVLNIIKSYKTKFGKTYGEIVICCDGPNIWRKKYFKYYKANRKKGREESEINWELVFKCLDIMILELENYFPYKVVKVQGAEGDDVIAVLTRIHATTDEKILIISTDKDFRQLQMHKNVVQYAASQKKFLKEEDPVDYRFQLICDGDVSDGVPNIFSLENAFVDKIRQTASTVKRKEEVKPYFYKYFETGDLSVFESIEDKDLKNRILTNILMIDLMGNSVPEELRERIINTYKDAYVPPRKEILSYMIKFGLRNLIDHIGKF